MKERSNTAWFRWESGNYEEREEVWLGADTSYAQKRVYPIYC